LVEDDKESKVYIYKEKERRTFFYRNKEW